MTIHSCSNCGLNDICVPLGIDSKDLPSLEEIVSANSPKQKGEIIVHQGDTFSGVYAVKSGMCKSYRVDKNGVEYIQAFHLPGELFGLDAIYSGQYEFTVEALDTLVVCELQFKDLKALSTRLPSLQNQLFKLLSRELYSANVNPIEHFEQSIEQKLAGFIYNLWVRLRVHGSSDHRFRLPMRRVDIANHLGLAPATVSRLFRKLSDKKLIDIQHREITLLDLPKLEALLHCHALENAQRRLSATAAT